MFRTLLVLLALVILNACSSENNTAIDDKKETEIHDKVVIIDVSETKFEQPSTVYARVGTENISQEDIDKILELQLFDLEWVKYDLRRKMLSQVVNEKTQNGVRPASSVEILIEPPMPPRLEITHSEKQPSRGNKSAPITLAVFCSYPSVHCAGMAKTYDALLMAYPEQIKLVFYDFPQAFHVNAGHAARAARCANEGGKFWPFHKGLLANYQQVSEKVIMRIARQVNLDTVSFKACFDNNQYTKEVKANLRQAEQLGLRKVPVTLINGLFMNGPRSIDTLRYFVDKELERLNIAPSHTLQQTSIETPTQEIPISTLPLRLEAITLGGSAENSTATIQHLTDTSSHLYKQDDEILPNTYLVMIQSNSVVLERAGKLERVILSNGKANDNGEDTSTISDHKLLTVSNTSSHWRDTTQRKKSLADPDEIPAGLEYDFQGVVSAKGETPLSRSWLTEKLAERETLKEHFEPAELEVEGTYVMRLTNIQENDFYQTLGLQEQDVVLRVNNEWVHSAQNSLFDSLENLQEVSVVLMRKGLPVHLNYHIN